MKTAVCFMTCSARPEARKVARALQLLHPDDEVVLFNQVMAVARPSKEIEEWGADVRIYVDNERRSHAETLY